MKLAFYVPNQPWLIDDIRVREDGVLVSALAGLTYIQVQDKYPGAVVTALADTVLAIEAMCKSVPRPIDAVDFYYAKTSLENYGRERNLDTESFKLTEHKNGRITAIYGRVGTSYWKFDDVGEMAHDNIIERIRRVEKCHQNAEGEVA